MKILPLLMAHDEAVERFEVVKLDDDGAADAEARAADELADPGPRGHLEFVPAIMTEVDAAAKAFIVTDDSTHNDDATDEDVHGDDSPSSDVKHAVNSSLGPKEDSENRGEQERIDGQPHAQSAVSDEGAHSLAFKKDCSRGRRSHFLCSGVRPMCRSFVSRQHRGRCFDCSFGGAVVGLMAMEGGIYKIGEHQPTTRSTCPSAKSLLVSRRHLRRRNTPFYPCHLSYEFARSDLPAARFVGECLSDRYNVDVCTLAYGHNIARAHHASWHVRSCMLLPRCHRGSRLFPAISSFG